jgi:hypothetical protein
MEDTGATVKSNLIGYFWGGRETALVARPTTGTKENNRFNTPAQSNLIGYFWNGGSAGGRGRR